MQETLKKKWVFLFYGLCALPIAILVASSIMDFDSIWTNGAILFFVLMATWVGVSKLGTNEA